MKSRNEVQGWFDPQRGAALVRMARIAPGEIVELGTAWGKSAAYILNQTDRNMTCVDFWGNDADYVDRDMYPGSWEYFQELLEAEGWKDRVTIIRSSTQEAAKTWDKAIGLLHIDAGHDYENVLADYRSWSPFIVSGGYIAFDDMHLDAVRRVVSEEVEPGAWTDQYTLYTSSGGAQWSARRGEGE